MQSKIYYITALITFFLSVFSMGLNAQSCTYDGIVIDGVGSCEEKFIVELSTYDIYKPNSSISGYTNGTMITFDFELSNETGICDDDIPYSYIDLTCIELSDPNTCIDESLIDPYAICSTEANPVCGCDGTTYWNACIAETQFGISIWEAGPCATDPTDCQAYYDVESPGDFFVFLNLSNNYTMSVWDFGDGSSPLISSESEVNWYYAEPGFYTVCLIVYNDDGCSSTYCKEIFHGTPDQICDFTDCVYPGDANGDGAANVYDLLNISLGYGHSGPERDVTGLNWAATYAPDWNETTITGVDFKHLDCDGDGLISYMDLDGITTNYTPDDDVVTVTDDSAPTFYLEFDQDSIFLDETTPSFFEVTATLYAGYENDPIEDLKGFAFSIDYPEDLVQEGSASMDYYDNSFFGSTNEIIWLPQDRPDVGAYDLAYAQKWQSKTGFGEVGTFKIIIVSDIIGGRSETYTPVNLSINGLTAINQAGAIKALGQTEVATLTIVNDLTSTKEQLVSNKMTVYPNPMNDVLNIQMDGIRGERVAIYNSMGQEVLSQQMQGTSTTIDVNALTPGVYLTKVWTNEGIAVQKIMKK